MLPEGHKKVLQYFLTINEMTDPEPDAESMGPGSSAESMGPGSSAESMGPGSSAKPRDNVTILLLEDITNGFHPVLIKRFTWALRDQLKAKSFVQIIATNLSCEFLEAIDLENVFRFVRYPDGTSFVRQVLHLEEEGTQTTTEKKKWKKNIRIRGLAKALFAKMVLIVEGPSDNMFFDVLMYQMLSGEFESKWSPPKATENTSPPDDKTDIEGNRMRSMLIDTCVVSAGGKPQIPQVVKYLQALDVCFFVVCDADALFLKEVGTKKYAAKPREVRSYFTQGENKNNNVNLCSRQAEITRENKMVHLHMALMLCEQIESIVVPHPLGQIISDRHLQDEPKLRIHKLRKDIDGMKQQMLKEISKSSEEMKQGVEEKKKLQQKIDETTEKMTNKEREVGAMGQEVETMTKRQQQIDQRTQILEQNVTEREREIRSNPRLLIELMVNNMLPTSQSEAWKFNQENGRVFAWEFDLEGVVGSQMDNLKWKELGKDKKSAFLVLRPEQIAAIINAIAEEAELERFFTFLRTVVYPYYVKAEHGK